MEADGVVFVIDGSDDSRFDEVREIAIELGIKPHHKAKKETIIEL